MRGFLLRLILGEILKKAVCRNIRYKMDLPQVGNKFKGK
jgi:hypothetical protein